jgi:hypothetical protein
LGEDQDNEIVAMTFDDSHIQNLVNAYPENPPKIQYENVPFQFTKRQGGRWTSDIKPKKKQFFSKGIHTIPVRVFYKKQYYT